MKKAIYALSADPITKGHLNIIKRAAKMFETLIVGIGNNASKNYMFTPEERLKMSKDAVKTLGLDNIEVSIFDGTLADFAFKAGANVVVRGLRNINDFQQEQDLANINKSLNEELETCFILTENENSYISSSASKEIIKNNYFAEQYLPLSSKVALQSKINNQCFIGVTGLMGSGKSFVSKNLEAYSKSLTASNHVEIHNLDLDALCNEVYNLENKTFEKQRQQILDEFETLDRSIIGKSVFSNPKKLKKLNSIFKNVIPYQVRQHSIGKKGIILINGATIVSMNLLTSMCNNKIVLVDTKKEIRHKRCLEGRDIKSEIIDARDEMMMKLSDQVEVINESIETESFGKFIRVNNDNKKINIKTIYDEVIKLTQA